jgi:hypothetical protein
VVVQTPWRAAIVLPLALHDRFSDVKPEAVHAAHKVSDSKFAHRASYQGCRRKGGGGG